MPKFWIIAIWVTGEVTAHFLIGDLLNVGISFECEPVKEAPLIIQPTDHTAIDQYQLSDTWICLQIMMLILFKDSVNVFSSFVWGVDRIFLTGCGDLLGVLINTPPVPLRIQPLTQYSHWPVSAIRHLALFANHDANVVQAHQYLLNVITDV